jgi:hypothetical protein
MHALKEVGDVGLGRSEGRLYPTLGGAPLAEMEQSNSSPFDLGELNHRVRFLAHVANHVAYPLASPLVTGARVALRAL